MSSQRPKKRQKQQTKSRKPLPCPICSKVYAYQKRLKTHMHDKHPHGQNQNSIVEKKIARVCISLCKHSVIMFNKVIRSVFSHFNEVKDVFVIYNVAYRTVFRRRTTTTVTIIFYIAIIALTNTNFRKGWTSISEPNIR